ncbi:MAG: tetratricopeptide repeat protein [Ignavibacteria bacterium]|nr:tetratricopeptide repeat protein [Ignavibacteria bacterium]
MTPAIPWKYAFPVLAVVALRIGASLFPNGPLWGVNIQAFLPSWTAFAFAAAAFLAAAPFSERVMLRGTSAVANALFPEAARQRITVHVLLAAAFGLLFSVAFIPFHFLGDGTHVVRTLYRYLSGAGYAEGTLMQEPLTVALYAFIARMIHVPASADGGVNLAAYTQMFMLVSTIVGGMYVFAVLRFSDALSADRPLKLAMTASVLGSAGSLFFFGYVEYYLFLYLFGTLFLLSALLALRGERFPLTSTLLLVAAIAFHLSAVMFIPAYLLLVWNWKLRGPGKERLSTRQAMRVFGAALLLGAVAYIALEATGNNTIFLPLSSTTWKLTLLSPQHLLDVANNILLNAPFGAAMLLLFLLARKETECATAALLVPFVAALSWTALCAAHIGIARDWDIYAQIGVAAALAALAFIERLHDKRVRAYFVAQAAVQPLLFLLPWIAVNVTFPAALARYTAITETYIDLAPVNYSAAHLENLRMAHAAVRDREAEAAVVLRMSRLTRDPYEYFKLLRVAQSVDAISPRLRRTVDAALTDMLALPDSVLGGPVGRDARSRNITVGALYGHLLAAISRGLSRTEKIAWCEPRARALIARGGPAFGVASFMGDLAYLEDALDAAHAWHLRAWADSAQAPADSGRSLSHVAGALGVTSFRLGRREEAVAFLRAAVSAPAAAVETWSDYGYACYQTGRYDDARGAFEHAVRMGSQLTNPYYFLAKLYARQGGREADIRRMLEQLLALQPTGERADEARAMLSALGGS